MTPSIASGKVLFSSKIGKFNNFELLPISPKSKGSPLPLNNHSERRLHSSSVLGISAKATFVAAGSIARSEGKAKRAAAEQELGRIEGELKTKLMELRS